MNEHYKNKKIAGAECKDIAEHFNFNLGNAIKYIWRAGTKKNEPAEKDLRKAVDYLYFEIEKRERENKAT